MEATLTPPYVPTMPEVRVQPPLVFVEPVWEYRIEVATGKPDEEALNALGADGWELVGVVGTPTGAQLYLKRLVR